MHSLQVGYKLLGGGTRLGPLRVETTPRGIPPPSLWATTKILITVNGKLDSQKIFLNAGCLLEYREEMEVLPLMVHVEVGVLPFAFQGNIIGFTGTAGNFLQAIGVYTF